MTNSDEIQHRSFYQPDAERVELREDSDDGVFSVRMPIATTGEVRNEGDDPLTRDELAGMGTQVDEQAIGVFLDHGKNPDVAGSRYSATEKVGEWRDAEISERDGGNSELVATAAMMDPDTLSGNTGDLREALASLKAQVERGFALSASIGWREDEDSPGGNDLMESSIVGIPADPSTTSQDAAVAHARDVLANADLPDDEREALVEEFRAVVMGSDEKRHLSNQQADMGLRVLDDYRSEQGNGSVRNFEDWLWSQHGYDEEKIHAARTALEEFYRETTPREDPVTDGLRPFLSDRSDGETSENHMTDGSTQSGDDPDETNDESDGLDESEYRESMLEMQRTQTETLNTLSEALREDDEDEEGDDEDEDDEDDEESENSSEPEDTQTVEVDGEEMSIQEAVDNLHEQANDADPADPADQGDEVDPDETQDADDEESEEREAEAPSGPDWRS